MSSYDFSMNRFLYRSYQFDCFEFVYYYKILGLVKIITSKKLKLRNRNKSMRKYLAYYMGQVWLTNGKHINNIHKIIFKHNFTKQFSGL